MKDNSRSEQNQVKEIESVLIKKVNELGLMIESIFISFKSFMHWKAKCSYDLRQISIENLGATIAKVIPAEFNDNEPHVYPLEIDAFKLLNPGYFKKSLFFHEFTHLYDLEKPKLIKIRSMGYIKAFTCFSEAHASEIELMCRLGFDSVDSDKSITLDSQLKEDNEQIAIYQLIQKEINAIEDNVNHDLSYAYKHYQYYLGILRFLRNRNVFDGKFEDISHLKELSTLIGDTKMNIANAVLSGINDIRTAKIIEYEIGQLRMKHIVSGIFNNLFTKNF